MFDFLSLPFMPFTMLGWVFSYALQGFLWTYVLWIMFLAVMMLKLTRDTGKLGKWMYRFGLPVVLVGYFIDFMVNITVGTLVFVELPKETTVTARLKRHKNDQNWRGTMTRWIAANLLDAFERSGKHV